MDERDVAEMRGDLERLRAVSDELANLSDMLNGNLLGIERMIQSTGVGVAVWIAVDSEWSFGWYRFKDGWRLAGKKHEDNPNLLLSSPRHVRLAARDRSSELIRMLISKSQQMVDGMSTPRAGSER